MNLPAGSRAVRSLMLRRDRITLPVRVLALAVMTVYFAQAIRLVYPEDADLSSMSAFITSPAGVMLSGPGYGLEPPTLHSFFAGVYVLYLLLGAALMNILLIVRHTRGEEEAGRSELVLAGAVDRHAPLVAALMLALAADVTLAVLAGGLLTASGYPAGGAFLVGAGLGLTGLVFAGVAAVTAQVATRARGSAGLAGAVLGAAFVIRGVGDALHRHGSALSWLSPLAWAQQTRPFVAERWWPLLLPALAAVVLAGAALALQRRRDEGAGLLGDRPGAAHAGPVLRGPAGLIARTGRGMLVGWLLAMVIAGITYGTVSDSVVELTAGGDPRLLALIGGDATQVVLGYWGYLGFMMAALVSVFTVLSVGRLAAEQTAGRTEWVLSTRVGARSWLLHGALVVVAEALVLLLVAGLTTGVASAVVTDRAEAVGDVTRGTLAHAPAVLVVAAFALLCLAVSPRVAGVAWLLPVYGFLAGTVGPMLDLPSRLLDLSPFAHLARVPAEPFLPLPAALLAVVAVALLGAALLAARHDGGIRHPGAPRRP